MKYLMHHRGFFHVDFFTYRTAPVATGCQYSHQLIMSQVCHLYKLRLCTIFNVVLLDSSRKTTRYDTLLLSVPACLWVEVYPGKLSFFTFVYAFKFFCLFWWRRTWPIETTHKSTGSLWNLSQIDGIVNTEAQISPIDPTCCVYTTGLINQSESERNGGSVSSLGKAAERTVTKWAVCVCFFFLWLIASCHTPPFGGGGQACRSVPANIRGEHLECRSRYLPRCSGTND